MRQVPSPGVWFQDLVHGIQQGPIFPIYFAQPQNDSGDRRGFSTSSIRSHEQIRLIVSTEMVEG